jgi:hypothetical protein
MKISAQFAVWLCGVFALVCLSVALSGFSGAPSVMDAAEREVSYGYAWFWTFLAAVAAVFGVLSWMVQKGKFGPVE